MSRVYPVRRKCEHRFPTSQEREKLERQLVELVERKIAEQPGNTHQAREIVKLCVRGMAALYETDHAKEV